jgi:hypothetical protein
MAKKNKTKTHVCMPKTTAVPNSKLGSALKHIVPDLYWPKLPEKSLWMPQLSMACNLPPGK